MKMWRLGKKVGAVLKVVREYFETKHMVNDKLEMKKWVDGDSNKGIIYLRDSNAGKVKKAVEKEKEGEELKMIEGAPVWEGLDLGQAVKDANME